MSSRLDVGTLEGRVVRLEPLASSHVQGLAAAAAEERQTYGFTFVPRGVEQTAAEVDGLLAAKDKGDAVPFAQVLATSGQPIGMTRFLTLRCWPNDEVPYAVEIGGTWLAHSAQRSGVNTEAKLLMLTHAFDTWGV